MFSSIWKLAVKCQWKNSERAIISSAYISCQFKVNLPVVRMTVFGWTNHDCKSPYENNVCECLEPIIDQGHSDLLGGQFAFFQWKKKNVFNLMAFYNSILLICKIIICLCPLVVEVGIVLYFGLTVHACTCGLHISK